MDSKLFKAYIELNGGVFCFLIPVLLFLAIYTVMQVFASILLAKWASQSERDNKLFYIFVGLTLSSNVFIFFQALLLTFAGVRQGRNVHNNIIKGLLYADLIRFFNRVPLGRILNRLNKDLKELDEVITNTFCSFFTSGFKVFAAIFICIYSSTPYALIPVVLVLIIFIKIRKTYISTQN